MSRRMPLEAWHQRRDQLLAEQPDLVRLDCMNPFQALAKWRPAATASADEAAAWAALWEARLSLSLSSLQARRTCGIRSALRLLMATPPLKSATAWLPEDVFPTYLSLASDANIAAATYATWPALCLPQQAAAGDWLVLPLPGAPTGCLPDAVLVQQLLDWAGNDKWIFIDAVYHYLEPEFLQPLLPLLRSSRALLSTSLSKSFLLRCMGGVTWVPEALSAMAEELPTPENSIALGRALTRHDDLPQRQQLAYRRCWQELLPSLQQLAPTWTPPRSGYLATFPRSTGCLLEHGFLAVPPEVFGAPRPGWSIVTCLHGLEGSTP